MDVDGGDSSTAVGGGVSGTGVGMLMEIFMLDGVVQVGFSAPVIP